jgi:hypothetical protein
MNSIRRHIQVAALSSAILLGGCAAGNGGSNFQGSWALYYQLLQQGFTSGTGRARVSREQAASVPYASLGYRVNGGNQSMLVLATANNGDLLWTAASHVVLLTRDGRILRSVGLPHDRAAMNPSGTRPVPPPGEALKGAFASQRLADFPDIGAYAVQLSCTTAPRRREIITILGAALATMRVDETCQSRNPRWSFTDNYWVDPESGFVWRSVQNLHPSGIRIQFDILRPPE